MKRTLNLTEREKLILQSVIQNFILTAQPVGSRTLVRRYNLNLSAATARNTMADLEDMGLLTHQHTSAGRIPTDLGYRIYVDELVPRDLLTRSEQKTIDTHLKDRAAERTGIFDDISNLLAEVTSMLAVIIAADMTAGKLDKIELVRVSSGRIMVILVIQTGPVKTILLELDSNISDDEIRAAANILNQRLSGLPLIDISARVGERLAGGSATRNSIVRLFVDFPDRIFTGFDVPEMHVGSTRHVLDHPEFSTPEKVKGIVELIEDRDIIVHLLQEREPGVTVTIGSENQEDHFKDKSVITSTYRAGGSMGTVGIIGPTRMNYSKLMALVDYTSRAVSKNVKE